MHLAVIKTDNFSYIIIVHLRIHYFIAIRNPHRIHLKWHGVNKQQLLPKDCLKTFVLPVRK